MKDNRGEITIPFVLTGIVLIIIAGICIFMLTGENGLFVPRGYESEKENEIVNNTTVNEVEQNTVKENNTFTIIPVE